MGAPSILLSGVMFGESARWHDGRLWFSDFYSHRVLRVDVTGYVDVVVELPQRPSTGRGSARRPDRVEPLPSPESSR